MMSIRTFLALAALAVPAWRAHCQGTTTEEFIRQGNTIISRDVRLQFLSPTLVRMEYSPASRFIDAPTVLVMNRHWAPFTLNVSEHDGWLVVGTGKLELRYRLKSGTFTPENLSVTWNEGQKQQSWKPGDKDDANLHAPGRTLDGARAGRPIQWDDGILSRSGYFLLDDSRTPVWARDSDWIAPRPEKDNQDWYLFAYGHDYRHALREFSELCGKIPMIPRYALGTWITDLNYEYLSGTPNVDNYRYTSEDVKNLVMKLRGEDIPVDVLVLDFAWHNLGWKGGYDWSPIFPHPKEFLAWAHSNGLRVSVNDHPGYGERVSLSDEDSHTAQIRRELGIPESPGTSYTLDLSRRWRFRLDPSDKGMNEGWANPGLNDSTWEELDAGAAWEKQGHPGYDGYAWYRKWVRVPSALKDSARLLAFGGVDDAYDLFVNGTKAGHFGSPGNSVWNTPTWTDIIPYVHYDQANLIALRVLDWGGDGGLVRLPAALEDKPPAEHGLRFDLSNKRQAEVFMKALHDPILDDGVDFWWVDGWGSYEIDGLSNQLWTNRVFYDYTQRHTGKRGFIFSRNGGLGNHRYPAYFTGDTYSQWEVLADEVPYTSAGGNALIGYITHDIGGFQGGKIDFDLYARWVEFGVFSPIVRLHSAHENPREGNLRMPWTYGQEGIDLVRDCFKLRERLLPYIYTYAHVAHETAMPLVRPLYLEYPELDKAYACAGEYLFGDDFLVAPVTDPSGKVDIFFPPGEWIDFATGRVYDGDKTVSYESPLERIPVFVRAGSIIPMAPDMLYASEKPLDHVIVDVYGPPKANFNLYEDDGESLDYEKGESAETPFAFAGLKGRSSHLTIGPTTGTYTGQPGERSYEIRLHGIPAPTAVMVNGRALHKNRSGAEGWSWDHTSLTATIVTGPMAIHRKLTIAVQ